ncbi:hypothetical protein PVBG_05546 [Plasmodium vivax Brazil I]|uniref:VIR protein n=1 Tax=Plasmodium vivax (strain Brazil I) TaxID=1033975 RepID=A0A0J9SZV4_PLAV1|nr:hypothetical protein PVBG_05546 [Plasmodium vivax Brazil I]
MSKGCEGHNGDYFDYHCYDRFIKYFDIDQRNEVAKNVFKTYMDNARKRGSFESSHYDLFEKISRRLAGDGIYWDISPKLGCSYINYWLNDEIDKRKIYLGKDDFAKFKNFAKSYDKDRNMRYRNESCEGYLERIYTENNYNRKKALYEMYDWYNWIQIYDVEARRVDMCYKYSLINRHYRNLKESYASDEELMAKLDYFINVINKSKKSVKTVCGYDILPPVSRLEDSKQAQDPDSRDKQRPGSTDESVSHPPQVSEDSVTQTAYGSHSQGLAEPGAEEPHAVDLHTVRTDQLEHRAAQSHVVGSPKVELLDVALREGTENLRSGTRSLSGLSGFRYQNEDMLGESIERTDGEMGKLSYGLRNTESGYSNTGDQLSTSVGDTKGTLTNVQDTFFSIVKDVQPGPVLGVSGGMGALFLLFKVFIALKIYLYVYNTFNKELSLSYNYVSKTLKIFFLILVYSSWILLWRKKKTNPSNS